MFEKIITTMPHIRGCRTGNACVREVEPDDISKVGLVLPDLERFIQKPKTGDAIPCPTEKAAVIIPKKVSEAVGSTLKIALSYLLAV